MFGWFGGGGGVVVGMWIKLQAATYVWVAASFGSDDELLNVVVVAY